jgi:hypothetical protein
VNPLILILHLGGNMKIEPESLKYIIKKDEDNIFFYVLATLRKINTRIENEKAIKIWLIDKLSHFEKYQKRNTITAATLDRWCKVYNRMKKDEESL